MSNKINLNKTNNRNQQHTVDDHGDAQISTPANGDILTYDSSSKLWKNFPTGGGILNANFINLKDFAPTNDYSTAIAHDIIRANSTPDKIEFSNVAITKGANTLTLTSGTTDLLASASCIINQDLSTTSNVNFNSVSLSDKTANPGSTNTIWYDSTKNFMLGSKYAITAMNSTDDLHGCPIDLHIPYYDGLYGNLKRSTFVIYGNSNGSILSVLANGNNTPQTCEQWRPMALGATESSESCLAYGSEVDPASTTGQHTGLAMRYYKSSSLEMILRAKDDVLICIDSDDASTARKCKFMHNTRTEAGGEELFSIDELKNLQIGGTGNKINEFSIDGTFSTNSDAKLPSEKAIKTYADAITTHVDSFFTYSSTLTLTLTGPWANHDVTAKYQRTNNGLLLWVPAYSASTIASSKIIVASGTLPVAIRPSADTYKIVYVQSNSAWGVYMCNVQASGGIQWSMLDASAFPNSGTCGITNHTLEWVL